MAIVYASFEVKLRGIEVLNEDDLELLRFHIQQLIDYGLNYIDGHIPNHAAQAEVRLIEAVRGQPRCATSP